jgi:hypothetical protein
MGKIIESKTLVVELWEMGVVNIHRPRDRNVYCPSYSFLREFGQWLNENHPPYRKEEFDCDDFTTWAIHSATKSLIENNQVQNCGHSIMACDLRINTSLLGVVPSSDLSLHENCIVRVDDGRWFFLEPQNGEYELYEQNNTRYDPPLDVWP